MTIEPDYRYDDALTRPPDELLMLTARNLLCGFLAGVPDVERAREVVIELERRLRLT